jgi:hypothetical protein
MTIYSRRACDLSDFGDRTLTDQNPFALSSVCNPFLFVDRVTVVCYQRCCGGGDLKYIRIAAVALCIPGRTGEIH